MKIKAICRKDKTNKNGTAPLFIRFTDQRSTKFVSIGLSVEPCFWDFDAQMLTADCPERQSLQSKIDSAFNAYGKKIKRLEALEVEVNFDTLFGARSKLVNGEAPAPAPQTATAVSSADGSDTETTRRTVKQRKSELDEYRRRYMQTPRIEDRKPVFVSRATRDRLDRIVRLLGERGMSVSGLIENIAIHHLADHEADVEYWRRM